MPLIKPASSSSDGDITIAFNGDDTGAIKAVGNIEKSVKDMRKSLNTSFLDVANASLFQAARISTGIRTAMEKAGVFIKKLFKRVILGGMLILGVSIASIFRGLREDIASLLENNLKGTQLAADVDEIKNKFTELKFSIAAAFLPLIQLAIPYIKLALDWLTSLINKIAMITAAFAGQKEVLQVIPGSAAELAKQTEKTKKAAQGALAAFDKIDVLTKPDTGEEKTTATPAVLTQTVPVTDEILSKVQKIKDEIAQWIADPMGELQELWGKVSTWFQENVITPVKQAFMDLMDTIFPPESDLRKKIIDPFSVGFYTLIESTKQAFKDAWAVVTDDSLTTTEKIKKIWDILKTWFMVNFGDTLIAKFGEIKTKALEIWNNVVGWFMSNVVTPLQIAFNVALDVIKGKFFSIFTNIKDFVGSIISGIVDSINEVISKINLIPGIDIPSIPAPSTGNFVMPHLATGAVIPGGAAFAAVLGDQPKGQTNIEAPADLIRQIVREELSNGQITIDMPVSLDGEIIYRNQRKVSMRHGKSLIAGGTV